MHGSNAQAVRDWMTSKDSEILGVTCPNAYWVIAYYFGNNMLSKVLNNPENFYLVLEPAVTAQLAIGKQDMRDRFICIAYN